MTLFVPSRCDAARGAGDSALRPEQSRSAPALPCPYCQSAEGKPDLGPDWIKIASVDDDVNSPDTSTEKLEPMSDITPFTGRRQTATAPMTVLHRFTKPGVA